MVLGIGRFASSKLKSIGMYWLSLALVLGSFTFAAPQFFGQVAHATTFSVCSSGCAYSTINAAISDSTTTTGDTINVAAGIYTEHVTVNKSITLLGVDKNTTFIDGGGDGVVVTITANDVILRGFTVRNSGTDINQHAGIGLVGGVASATSVTGVTIEDNIISSNITGVAVMGASGNTISNNTISGSARYGIVLEVSPYNSALLSTANTISGNTITNNAQDGVYVGKDCNGNIITGNVISGATGTTEANGIYLWKSASNTITNNIISSNAAFGVEIFGSKNNTITGNDITGNLDGFHIRNINETDYPGYSIRDNNISNNKIYDNTRVNLYGSPNFDFNIENNWWGSSDLVTVKSKLASWDISGGVVLGTTVFLNFTPYYIDSALTTLSNLSDITSFTIPGQTGVTVINNTNHTVAINMPYRTDVSNLTPTITTTGLSISPASSVVYDFTAPQTYTVTPYDEEYAQLYTVTVTVSIIDPIEAAFNQISATLVGLGIANNLNDVTTDNITNFSGLYFEKSVLVNGIATKMGRITFNGSLDLSNTETIAFLQALGEKLDANTPGVIGLDFTGVSNLLSLYGMSATIKFYGLDALGLTDASTSDEVFTKITVLDDNGNIIDKTALVSGSGIYVGACSGENTECYTFTVNVNHFTKFKIDNTAPIVTINKPSDITVGTAATISGTIDDLTSTLQLAIGSNKYTLSSANISGTNWSYPLSTATLGTGTYTIKITAVDASGNTNYATTILGVNAPIVTGSAIQTNPELGLAVNNAAQTSTDNQEDKAILGSETKSVDSNSGTENKIATLSSTSDGWIIFGLMWYWWLAIIAAIALIWWIIATAIHNNSDKS